MPDINFIAHPLTGTPFGAALDLAILLAPVCWVLSITTRDYSWVDRIWQICPPVYCLIVAASADFESTRLNVMTALVVLWGARLSFNLARKGGFRVGAEDHRWAVVRERLGPVGSQVLNVVFVAVGQMLLIWLFTAPIHQAWVFQDAPFNVLDVMATVLFAALLVGETVADEQMWRFQQDKKRRMEAGEPVAQPFMTTGLFRFCRHPNYLCELGMWWVFYLFAVAASGTWIHWSALGFVFLSALFAGSIPLGERISAERYPSYRDYKAPTRCLIPLPRRGARAPG
ncbi:MAG: DUF1295 domain-containing protein [Gammaproteobacteria bacterium]|nr:DUF1295 domain-containing protein [Gammaproteobacteria bacterium]